MFTVFVFCTQGNIWGCVVVFFIIVWLDVNTRLIITGPKNLPLLWKHGNFLIIISDKVTYIIFA